MLLPKVLRQLGRHSLAIAILLGLLASREARAQRASSLDEFLCLRAVPTRRSDASTRFTARRELAVQDRLTASLLGRALKIDLPKAVGLCMPPSAAATHLEAYAARLSRTRPPQQRPKAEPQRVTNRFGTDDLRVKGLEGLLVPAAATLDPPGASSPLAAVDHFTCYAADRASGPRGRPAASAALTVESGLGTLQLDVRAPVHLCFPADKNGEDPSAPEHPNALACYRAKLTRTRPPQPDPFPRQVATANQFGSELLTLTTTLDFCVPSQVSGVSATPTPQRTAVPTPTATVTPPPGFTLRINPASVAVDIGESAHFTATAVFENGDLVDFTERLLWISGGEIAIAPNAPGDRGRIDTVDTGQTVISVLDAATGVTSTTTGDDAVLTVNWTLERIELLPTTATRGRGESIRLRATGHFAGGFTRSIADRIVYASSDDAVASPTNAAAAADHSRILAAGEGTAVLSATDPLSGVSSTTSGDDVTMTVLPPLERCTILQAGPITIATEHDYQLTARGFYPGDFERVLTQQVVWASDAPTIMAAPNTEGDRSRLNALAPGEAHVTATDSITGVACAGSVTFVVGAPSELYLQHSTEWMASRPRRVGRSWHLRALQRFPPPIFYKFVTQKVLFSSSDLSIVVAPNVGGDRGRVDAVGGGTAIITAIDPANGQVSQGLSLRVLDGLTRVEVSFPDRPDGKPRFLIAGYYYALEATGHFADGVAPLEPEDVTFVSNNPAVVEIVPRGPYSDMRGIGFGTATISAIDNATGISSDAFGESLRVAVPGPLQRIVLVPSRATRRMGGEQAFAAIAYYVGGVTNVVTQLLDYTSSAPAVAVAHNFYPSRSAVEAVAGGVAVITATDPVSGISTTDSGDDATLTVVGPLQRLRVEPSDVSRSVGRSFSFTAIGTDAVGREVNLTQDVAWSSSTPAVAVAPNVIGNRSRIDAVTEGSTTISAFDPQDGVSSTATGDNATFAVSGILESLTLGAETTQITVGQPIQLTATGHLVGGATINLTQQVEYTSSTPAVAQAENQPGDRSRITALQPGTAVISARDPGTGIVTSASGTVTLTVIAP